MSKEKYEIEAMKLLRTSTEGVLSTISVQNKGFPFGSFSTFCTDRDRSILIYASDLAQHTKNILQNQKVSFTLFSLTKEADKQDSKRLTLQGCMKKVSDDEYDVCKQRFHRFFPKSKAYENMHDFNIYKISIKHARWIGGFGQIAWLKEDKWKEHKPKWSRQETEIVQHMNEDHQNVVISALHAQHNIKDKEARMECLTIDGYYVKSKQNLFFVSFEEPVLIMKNYREALVNQAKKYRSFEL